MPKKKLANVKTVKQFMELTGVRDEVTLVEYLILGYSVDKILQKELGR